MSVGKPGSSRRSACRRVHRPRGLHRLHPALQPHLAPSVERRRPARVAHSRRRPRPAPIRRRRSCHAGTGPGLTCWRSSRRPRGRADALHEPARGARDDQAPRARPDPARGDGMSQHVLRIGGREYRAEVKELTPERATVVVDGTEYASTCPARPAEDHGSRADARVGVQAMASVPPPRRCLRRPRDAVAGAARAASWRRCRGSSCRSGAKEGESVAAGQTLLVMEAMKMENAIATPYAGTVTQGLRARGRLDRRGRPARRRGPSEADDAVGGR
jgi:glutaconyl-CoA/methylmalonyl-CoA decarboxylase subunit gamma